MRCTAHTHGRQLAAGDQHTHPQQTSAIHCPGGLAKLLLEQFGGLKGAEVIISAIAATLPLTGRLA